MKTNLRLQVILAIQTMEAGLHDRWAEWGERIAWSYWDPEIGPPSGWERRLDDDEQERFRQARLEIEQLRRDVGYDLR